MQKRLLTNIKNYDRAGLIERNVVAGSPGDDVTTCSNIPARWPGTDAGIFFEQEEDDERASKN